MSISHFERDGCPSIVTLTSEKHKQKVESCFLSPKILTKSILVYMFFYSGMTETLNLKSTDLWQKIKSPPSIQYTITILWLYQIEKNHITHRTYRGIARLFTTLNKSCRTMQHLNHGFVSWESSYIETIVQWTLAFLSLVVNHKKIAKKTENDSISHPLQTRKESHEPWQDFII